MYNILENELEAIMKKTLNYQEEILEEIKDLPQEQISNLLKIIRIFKDSVMKQRKEDLELEKELREWDRLSDEAFASFESIS